MIRYNQTLLLNRGLPLTPTSTDIINDNLNFINNLDNDAIEVAGIRISNLPPNPPFEIHPYKNNTTLSPFEKYIIGTFPPISYVYDILINLSKIKQPIGENIGERKLPRPGFSFFHGNKKLMWDFLLTNLECVNMPINRNDIPAYLSNILTLSEINYGDIIDSCQRKLKNNRYKGNDNLLHNIDINKDLLRHILSSNCSRYLLFNTASIYGNGGLSFNDNGLVCLESDAKAFDLFIRAIQDVGYDIQIRVNEGENIETYFPWTSISNLNLNQRKNKIAFELKIINPTNNNIDFCQSFKKGDEKSLIIITPFSPAVAERRNVLAGNPIVNNWLNMNNGRNTKNMLFEIYQAFRNGNWNFLFNLNQ